MSAPDFTALHSVSGTIHYLVAISMKLKSQPHGGAGGNISL